MTIRTLLFMMCNIFEGIFKEILRCFMYKEVIAVDQDLTWKHLATECVSSKTNESSVNFTRAVCVNRFHLSQWASMAACKIASFT